MPSSLALEALNKAYAREREVRDFAILRLPHNVCGIPVNPMRLRDYVLLSIVRNPFVAGGYRRKVDALQFIWLLHPTWIAPTGGILQRFKSRARRAKVCAQVARIEYNDLAQAIDAYLDEMFMDAPGSRDNGKAPTVSFAASIIHAFKAVFSRQETLDMPLPELWQYVRMLSDGVTFNRFSDRAKADYLRSLYEEAG